MVARVPVNVSDVVLFPVIPSPEAGATESVPCDAVTVTESELPEAAASPMPMAYSENPKVLVDTTTSDDGAVTVGGLFALDLI